MIFLVGCISLVQVALLPGLILIRLFKLRRGFIQTLVYVFGLSLIFNFLWVFLLTVLKINFSAIHYALFVIEITLAFYLYRDKLLNQSDLLAESLNSRIKSTLDTFINFFKKKPDETIFFRAIKNIIIILLFIWAISGMIWLLNLSFENLDTVFRRWDAVVSWNRWAVDWFNNIIPSPMRYPQLIPANFSITYSFLQASEIQFFAKAIMPLFTIFTLLMFIDLAFEYRNPGILFGAVIYRYITNKFMLPFVSEGYVEVALIFFAFLVGYTLLKSNKIEDDKIRINYLYLGAIFAAGAALTKQNGLLIFMLYPLLAINFTGAAQNKALLYDQFKALIKPLLISLALFLPWYVLNEVRISMELNTTIIDTLIGAGLHGGRSYLERIPYSITLLEEYAYLFLLVLIILPFIPKEFRKLSFFTIFPYLLVWQLFLSYSVRNLSMVFPFLALAAGLGFDRLLNLFLNVLEKVKASKMRFAYWFVPLFIVVVSVSILFPDGKIQDQQIEEQKKALQPVLNKRLYEFFEERGEYGEIMTYYSLNYLPTLEDYFIRDQFQIYGKTYENLESHPDIEYFLVWGRLASEEVLGIIEDLVDNDLLEFHFEYFTFKFYELTDREAILDYLPEQ